MKDNNWLPNTNDTRAVLAATFNAFFASGKVRVIPSAMPVDIEYEQLPATVNAIGTLVVNDVDETTATNVHKAIHEPKRSSTGWSGMSYMWPTVYSFRIYLVPSKSGFSVLFPILYDDTSDIDKILEYARNPFHQKAFDALGISPDQMTVRTYTYDASDGWSVRT